MDAAINFDSRTDVLFVTMENFLRLTSGQAKYVGVKLPKVFSRLLKAGRKRKM